MAHERYPGLADGLLNFFVHLLSSRYIYHRGVPQRTLGIEVAERRIFILVEGDLVESFGVTHTGAPEKIQL